MKYLLAAVIEAGEPVECLAPVEWFTLLVKDTDEDYHKVLGFRAVQLTEEQAVRFLERLNHTGGKSHGA